MVGDDVPEVAQVTTKGGKKKAAVTVAEAKPGKTHLKKVIAESKGTPAAATPSKKSKKQNKALDSSLIQASQTPLPETPDASKNTAAAESKAEADLAADTTNSTPKNADSTIAKSPKKMKTPAKVAPVAASPAVQVAESTESKSPAKRTKSSPDSPAKKPKMDDESATEEKENATVTSSQTSKLSEEEFAKAVDSMPLRKLGKNSEECLVKVREEMVESGKTEEEVESEVRKLRRKMQRRLYAIKCKRCLKRGHHKQECQEPARIYKCYKCGSADHKALQ